tara:strand:+ start:1638 stop:1820 length:183 start_codon:yes stop_codon:yes gene_type:complete
MLQCFRNTSKWKDKRIAAINRISICRGHVFNENNPYFREYQSILNSKAKNKKEYILERNK